MKTEIRNTLRELPVYAVAALIVLGMRLAVFGIVVYAQQGGYPFACPSASAVTNFIRIVQTLLMMAIIAIVIFVLIFNMFGFISTMAMRIGEFFNERIRFVFELILIYVFFLWGLDNDNLIYDKGGCAAIRWDLLWTQGPLFFRLVYWLLTLIGVQPPTG